MRQSQLFTKTRKEAPKDEVSKNAQLLIRAGFIFKEMAGVYSLLPLGFRVIKKIEQIIREEMQAIGAQEIHLASLQNPETWKKTGRWDNEALDVWFKTKLNAGGELGLASTHEDPLTNIMTNYIASHRDVPVYTYQFQTKFRNELRAKSGIMRGREFLMKDLYSFSKDDEAHEVFYQKARQAYVNIFDRAGIGEQTFYTYASGGDFTPNFSHEFQTITDAGEDTIYLCRDCEIAINDEIIATQTTCPVCNKEHTGLEVVRSIEVGNIFPLATRFSDALGLHYRDENEQEHPVVMGSYGIGLGRLMGTIVEVLSDDAGIVWPKSVAPFRMHLISIGDVSEQADALYQKLHDAGVEVLYDDRDMRPGGKFADSDLIGIPTRVVISEKTLAEGKLEVKDRKSGEVQMTSEEILFEKIA